MSRRIVIALAMAVGLTVEVTGIPQVQRALGGQNSIARTLPTAEAEMKASEEMVNMMEARTLKLVQVGSLDPLEEETLLGKLIFFDADLSVNRNEACAFCHMPETGFGGSISFFNTTTGSYPGSIRTRFNKRRPPSLSYSAYAPRLHYNASRAEFVGGAFWDMRATGVLPNSAIVEQAQDPPLNPVEMGLIDSACMVWKVSRSRYRGLAEKVWGPQSFAVHWPHNIESVCSQPGPPPDSGPFAVHLTAVERGMANRTFDQIAQAIGTYESSSEVNPFSSKYDAVNSGTAQFTADEKFGYILFRSPATHCNECHRDGGPGEEPLFTDFTASNLGVPRNPENPFYGENVPDGRHYTANPEGANYIDNGVGEFLARMPQLSGRLNPSELWAGKAASNMGKFKAPTLRNVDKRPRPDFVKAYMHNGYFKSLKEVVHFYNTRDTLPRCKSGDMGEKITCWPPPEVSVSLNGKQLGHLGLSDKQEDQVVAFLKTLSDGYVEGPVRSQP